MSVYYYGVVLPVVEELCKRELPASGMSEDVVNGSPIEWRGGGVKGVIIKQEGSWTWD